jgi:hypothetical protein
MSHHEIAELVQEQLDSHKSEHLQIQVLENLIRQDTDWWHVPVRLTTNDPRTYQYYELLTDVEDEIFKKQQMNVLLVPAE